MISKTNIFLMDINSKSYHVYDANDENKKEYYIPKKCLDGFDFDPDYMDENGDLKTNMLYPAIKKDGRLIYLDKSDRRYWKFSYKYGEKDESKNEWIEIIGLLLEMRRIVDVEPQVADDLLNLYREKDSTFKRELKKALGLENTLKDENLFNENKASLVFPPNRMREDETIEQLMLRQWDNLGTEIIGAGNAFRNEDFHLVVGKNNDNVLTDNVSNELRTYFEGSPRVFEERFTNRMLQLTQNPLFIATLKMNFITIKGHLILDIVVPPWTGEILHYKGEFYLRSQSINNHLKGDAVVKLIAARNNPETTNPIV